MVLGTSALLAILADEPEAPAFETAIEGDPVRLISAATLLEASIVVDSRWGADGVRELDLLIEKAGIEVVTVDAEQVGVARRAYRDFGRGRHPAGLDYGDCFSYALARISGEPLLFKGGDFARTDLPQAPR